jgi:hypothetical protein
MKCGLVYHLAAVAGLVSGRAVASNMDGAGILGGEHFRMALLPRQSVSSLQVFNGALGNVAASAITKTEEIDRPFGVDGSTFVCFYQPGEGYVGMPADAGRTERLQLGRQSRVRQSVQPVRGDCEQEGGEL